MLLLFCHQWKQIPGSHLYEWNSYSHWEPILHLWYSYFFPELVWINSKIKLDFDSIISQAFKGSLHLLMLLSRSWCSHLHFRSGMRFLGVSSRKKMLRNVGNMVLCASNPQIKYVWIVKCYIYCAYPNFFFIVVVIFCCWG